MKISVLPSLSAGFSVSFAHPDLPQNFVTFLESPQFLSIVRPHERRNSESSLHCPIKGGNPLERSCYYIHHHA